MAAKRRTWWHARPGYLASLLCALLFAPTVWVALVKGAIDVVERVGAVERDVIHLRGDLARHDAELRALRSRHR